MYILEKLQVQVYVSAQFKPVLFTVQLYWQKKKKVSIKGLISRHINWAIGNKWAIKWAIKLDNISQYSFNCPLQITPLPYGAL